MEIPPVMKSNYFTRRLKDHTDCLKAIEEKNFEPLERIGHQMKGNAQTFGFEDLAWIGDKLEIAALEKDWVRITTLVKKFGSYLEKNHSSSQA